MTDLLSGMPLDFARDLGRTLLHFLWQGALLAALLNVILPMCRSAIARHNWALGTLMAMALAPVATFLFLHGPAESGGVAPQGMDAAGTFTLVSASLPWIDWLVVFWLTGVAVLSLRAVGGWYVASSLGRLDTLAVPADLLRRCQALQRRLAVTGPVRFLLSRRINVPVVIGWLSPVVLIPVSAIGGLAPQQLEALILHELAHIRRLDTIANILLVAVETILFYHPAVWWVSRHVRIEREHCCDDCAVSACGDVGVYVEALTALAAWKAADRLALAANGGTLKTRVARLLETPESRRFSLSAMAGLAFLGAVIASVAVAQAQPQSAGRPPADGSYLSNDRIPVLLRPTPGTHTLVPYPTLSARLGEQGISVLMVRIGTDGVVTKCAVSKSSGSERLDVAACTYVKSNWTWLPPMGRNGRPATATTRVNVVFKLKRSPPPQKP